jgi:hypothetical protein
MIHKDPTHDRIFTDYCDSEDNWGPLLMFRPALHERMRAGRMLALSALLGLLFGVPGSVVLLLVGRLYHRPSAPLFALPAALTAVYFAVSLLTFVPAWNRRAARVSRIPKR